MKDLAARLWGWQPLPGLQPLEIILAEPIPKELPHPFPYRSIGAQRVDASRLRIAGQGIEGDLLDRAACRGARRVKVHLRKAGYVLNLFSIL